MRYTHRAPLRWSDLDAQGHVNNSLFVDYLQEARTGFLLSGPVPELLDTGVIVVSHSVEYLAAMEYSTEPVEIGLGVCRLGGARFELDYQVRHEGEPKARARTLLCPFDFDAQAPRRLTEAERAYFASHRVEAEPFRDLTSPRLGGRGYATEVPVRWSDLDRYGHVNNVKFFDYVQQARIEMTTAVDPGMARAGAGVRASHTWLIARQDLSYLAQLDHRLEPYRMVTAPVKLGRTSITLGAELCDGDTLFARAATVLVCADTAGNPTELPDETRHRLSQWLVTTTEGDEYD
ncbi:MAG: thioesterase family protein [Propionibacteriaceae bacterium]|nr:thioesterase family protein [Propionibacteriaceae bacterium]